MFERLERNRRALLDRVARSAQAAGRDPEEIRLVAVTKTVEPELAALLVELGTEDLGENRVTELERKVAWFEERGLSARWHFIGHVQRNKARRVVRLADEIHSVDSARLVSALGRVAEEEGRRPALYLQAKLSAEEAKTGAPAEEIPALLELAREGPLPVAGLMTMAPLSAESPDEARTVFRRLAELAAELPGDAFVDGRPHLSMGMSQDFEDAVEAGAHVLRIGSAFFEDVPRPQATRNER